jgi:tetratricopeptide (TPR) repeat protein
LAALAAILNRLAPADLGILQQVARDLQAGRLAEAEAALKRLSPAAHGQADALYMRAVCAERRGQPDQALALFDQAIRLAPGNPAIWNSRGNLLNRRGDSAGAIESFRRAVAVAPGHFEAWFNMGSVAVGAGQWAVAADALARARQLAPGDGRVLVASGLLAQQQGRLADAEAAYRGALAINARDGRAWHNLATVLRRVGQPGEALAAAEGAIGNGMAGAETATLRAHLLAELGRFAEAVAQYRAVIAATPDYIDAQETLALLLPQIDRRAEALDGFAAAVATGAVPAFWLAAINAARALGDGRQMLRWADAAAAAHGPHADWALARIAALTLLGDRAQAIAEGLAADQQSPAVRNHLAYLYLQAGDLAAAEAHALATTQLAPDSQSAWALLTVIWRLTGDAREQWLADYDRLVMTADLVVPPGWPDLPSFMTDLATTLTRLHVTQAAPAEQSLRGGTQTRGKLFETADPVLQALEASLIATIETCLAPLTPEVGHPFLGRLAGAMTMAGSWSVRLASEGFHISHIHPSGWLSSAFYVVVPQEIAEGSTAGALLFGVPDAALGIDLPPRRVVTPKVGRLAIFPSYFWHGTGAFVSEAVRMTVAFDAQPRPSAA